MKAVAIPYIIAILLGVAVIGLIGYWLISQGGKAVSTGTSAECQAKQFSYCVQWQNNDKDCMKNQPQDITGTPNCTNPKIDYCQKLGLCK